MNITFMGTPAFGVPCLQALIDSHHAVVGVFTQPDRRQGRGQKYQACPIKACALQAGLTVHQPEHLKQPETLTLLKQADVIIVIAYGLILPQAVLDTPPYGCINVHASLLPRWRGAAPIQRAIQAGDSETGISLMQMDAGLDTGAVLHQVTCPISPTTTSISLSEQLADLAIDPLLDWLDAPTTFVAKPQPNSGISYAKKLSKAESRIDWQQPAVQIERQLRAMQPWPGLAFQVADITLRVHALEIVPDLSEQTTPGQIICADAQQLCVATGDGALRITRLQYPNKAVCNWSALYHGHGHLLPVNACLT
jgi:methionyl-tRNA formyltransferase